MINDIESIYYNEEQLKEIVASIGKQISDDYKDKNLMLLCILKGSVVFMADLMRAITIPCEIEFLKASSYGSSTNSSGNVKMDNEISFDVSKYDIIVVEDILDSGRTLQKLTNELLKHNPKSLKIATLMDKPERRAKNITIKADYVGAQVPDAFIVGYGLDYAQKYRNLPFIGVLKSEKYS